MSGNTGSIGGSFFHGLADSANDLKDRKAADQAAQDARDALAAARESQSWQAQGGYQAPGSAPDPGGPYNGPVITSDPVDTALTPQQRAFLNSVAGGESNGAYNVRYSPKGGVAFDLAAGHPRVYEPGPAGPSSAAGRYGFTWSTWKDRAGEATPFNERNQDVQAWSLASDRYRAGTGRDLAGDLSANGLTTEMMRVLAPTWASFNGGYARHTADYNASLARYTAAPPAPQAARQVASPQAPAQPLSYGLPAPPLAIQAQPQLAFS